MSNVRDKRLLFKSLQMKLVLIMVLLIVSVMAVVGTFLVNSITNFYVTGFREQMASVFDTETLEQINKIAVGENAGDKIKDVLSAYSTSLGINSYRNFYILDGKTGLVITGSNDALDKDFTQTSNIVTAMTGKVGNKGLASDDYMDVAIPINGDKPYIIYIIDSKNELSDINWTLCTIVIQTMLFALLTAVLLSFLLSKAITNPIENLKKSAKLVAVGDFSHPVEVQSSDEIGELTGTFNEMAAILRDTIEQVQGERDKLNTLFLHMTDGVAAFTSDGKIIHMNYATEKLLEIKFEENLTFNEVFHGMNMPNEIEAEQKGYIQTEIQRENKSLTVLFARYGNESDGGIMAVIRDITEQKKLEDSRREFVANVSHELRTPITNIKSYTETIIDSGSDLPQETTLKFLGVIESEADRMARIVKDLLTLSRLDYGRMDVKFDKFSMKELIHDVYQAMILEAGNCGHKLITDVGTDPIYIVGDRERLQQVVVNIVSNAFKYTSNGGIIDISCSIIGDKRVKICVKDNGIGIPEKDIPRLFERFYRVDKARSRKGGGTGLGLAIAKDIVEMHKGTIYVESKLEVGTTVTIILPRNLQLSDEDKMHEEL